MSDLRLSQIYEEFFLVTPCSLINFKQRFGRPSMKQAGMRAVFAACVVLATCLAYLSSLKMAAMLPRNVG
jgi:hypothetical protein